MIVMKRILILLLVAYPYFSQSQNLPSWVKNPPTESNTIYAVGKGTSSNAETAERKARLDANVGLAEQVSPAVITVTTRLESTVRRNKALTEKVKVVRKTVTANLQDVSIVKKFTFEDKDIHTAYILLEMPRKSINQSIIQAIDNDKELYDAVKKTKTYKNLKASM